MVNKTLQKSVNFYVNGRQHVPGYLGYLRNTMDSMALRSGKVVA